MIVRRYKKPQPVSLKEIEGVPITRCPPGSAIGSQDIADWSRRRSSGKSGVKQNTNSARLLRLKCRKCGHLSEQHVRKSELRRVAFKCSVCKFPIKVRWSDKA